MADRTLEPAEYVQERTLQIQALERYAEKRDPHDRDRATSRVKCAGCTACCRGGYTVGLAPFEDATGLEIEGEGENRHLKKQANGDCIHLVNDQCTVYEHRPLGCRYYDCRDFAVVKFEIQGRTALNAVVDSWQLRNTPADRVAVTAAAFFAKDRALREKMSATDAAARGIQLANLLVKEMQKCPSQE